MILRLISFIILLLFPSVSSAEKVMLYIEKKAPTPTEVDNGQNINGDVVSILPADNTPTWAEEGYYLIIVADLTIEEQVQLLEEKDGMQGLTVRKRKFDLESPVLKNAKQKDELKGVQKDSLISALTVK